MIKNPCILAFESWEQAEFINELRQLSNLWLGGRPPESNLYSDFPRVAEILEQETL